MENFNVKIERVTKDNYHMFDDMVFWRINGVERRKEEKEKSRTIDFSYAYSQLQHQGFYAYAALVEGRYVGWITLMFTPKLGKWSTGVLYVDEVWTSPEYRRRGIAFSLMEKIKDVQKETGAKRIRLYTDNFPAVELYKKCGFKISAEEVVFMERS
ncbi:GNAT family N-acetyltransferase [Alkaliphilus serpentinus]|uniref:GNAT family N-acetyltransferase n=1 Tax=Alkaliphilus serpentinus TaxID=1482731 RepID=A0A833HQ74_9FIRM|nr:GNAT family N-acetyltransferase [Alkaliphilus serpentinus]KAB3531544.1 GNAT family N-acetyltransferase [Alkaliphilus serpentinus]